MAVPDQQQLQQQQQPPHSLGLPAAKTRAFRPVLPKIESDINFQDVVLDSDGTPFLEDALLDSAECRTPPLHPLAALDAHGSPPQRQESDTPGTPHGTPQVVGKARVFSVDSVAGSVASSGWQYAEPTQTLFFLDWDDTLFPCTELFERWCLPRRLPSRRPKDDPFPEELERDLTRWRAAVQEYLSIVCALSDRCVIVTNSSPPWVENCVNRFAPNLLPFFNVSNGRLRGVRVVYAGETLRKVKASGSSSCCCPLWTQSVREAFGPAPTNEERRVTLTEAKLSAMRQEATIFYSRYPGQTWKNVISIGDMKYERDAVQELSASRVSPARERLRTKALVLPHAPTLSELTLWLRLVSPMLPLLAGFDGDVDVDLCKTTDPLRDLAKAFCLPALAAIDIPQLRFPYSIVSVADSPGIYRVVYKAAVGCSLRQNKPTCHVQAGSFLEVAEVAKCAENRCIRGRIVDPPGWITLMNLDNGYRWAEKEDDHCIEEALDEVAVAVQDALAEPHPRASLALPGGIRSPTLGPLA